MKQPGSFIPGLVSCVTPVYNGAAYLPRLLDSLLAQSYPQMEVILSDDGSADDTLHVMQGYRERFAARGYDYRIVSGPHQNASAAINRGLNAVTGEFLIWPDADDRLEPESVARRVAFLQEHPECQCVRSLAYYFDDASGKPAAGRDEQQGDLNKEKLFWDVLESRTFVCCGCYLLRTEAFFAIYPGRHIPESEVGQNFQMLLPFLYRHRCPTLRQELYGVAVRSGSHSRMARTREQEQERYREYERLVDVLAAICPIKDNKGKRRIAAWKMRRRYQLACRYGDKKEALRAIWRLGWCGGLRVGDLLSAARCLLFPCRL